MTEAGPSPSTKQTEIFVIAGFLGSGKTTLLKRILSWDSDLRDTVVIVNEFGKVGIDSNLLTEDGSEVVELTSGCVCCSMKADLNLTLKALLKKYTLKRILIELSGVGDPVSVVETLNTAALFEHMVVKKVITVVDADNWEVRDCFGSLFSKQIQQAELILLNKCDTVEPTQIPLFLQEINEMVPDSRVIPTTHCNVDQETLWEGSAQKSSKPINLLDGPIDFATDLETADQNFVSFSFHSPAGFNEMCFWDFVRGLPWELFRMKGTVRFEDRTVFVNHVGNKTNCKDWADREETRLVFIGWAIDIDTISQNLKQCVSQSRDHS